MILFCPGTVDRYLSVGATCRCEILHDNVADRALRLLVVISLEVCKCRVKKGA